MLDENKHIDSLFADGLKGLSVSPDPKIWEEINNQLATKRKKKRMLVWFVVATAASLLLLFTLSNRELMQSEPNQLQFSETAEKKKKIEKVVEETVFETPQSTIPMKKETGMLIANSNTEIEPFVQKESEFEQKENLSKWKFNKEVEKNSLAAVQNTRIVLPDTLAYPGLEKISFGLMADNLQIQKNLMLLAQQNNEKEVESKWSLIGQVSSAYSSYSGKKSGNRNESGLWNVGGGVKVNYSIGKNLAVQTGLVYNRFGQNLSSGQNLMFNSDNRNVLGIKAEAVFSDFPVETSAGPIQVKAQAVVNSSGSLALASYSASETEITQSFETIEVPFLLRYNLSQKKLGVFVTGGINANWIVENAIYQNNGGKTKIGKTGDIRTTNFSSQFGLGFEYSLSSRFQIGLEPSVKYYLNSISKNNKYNYKPYSIGLFTGIRYNF